MVMWATYYFIWHTTLSKMGSGSNSSLHLNEKNYCLPQYLKEILFYLSLKYPVIYAFSYVIMMQFGNAVWKCIWLYNVGLYICLKCCVLKQKAASVPINHCL